MTFAFPELLRPQYPSSPEVLLSSLAWSVVTRAEDKRDVGLIYHRRGPSTSKKVKIEQTMPSGAALAEFGAALLAAGLGPVGSKLPDYVAPAVANALKGAQPLKGVGIPSSGIGLCGALLQDPVGGLATANPPNFAKLLCTMHRLGGMEGPTAAEKWLEAASFHGKNARLSIIESALAKTSLQPYLEHGLPASGQVQGTRDAITVPDWWHRDVLTDRTGTPFSWFRTSWDRLCSHAWYSVLPPRRWAGWAVCVLRNALGFAFLWESNFYFELARGVVDKSRDPETVAQWALRPTKPLVPYQKGSISQMDVMPAVKQALTKGLACRAAMLKTCSNLKASPKSLPQLIDSLRTEASKDSIRDLETALRGAGERGGLPNLIETVRYSLLARGIPESPDHNSLLRVVSRNFTHVVPGPEWIVVMSAMSAETPSASLRLGDVRRSLDDLGFKPRIDFLVSELERAGLCASASDGDEGIDINLGFSGA